MITPKEALAKTSQEEQAQMVAAEMYIDQQLAKFDGDKIDVYLNSDNISQRALDKVLAKYEAAGWQTVRVPIHDPRPGESCWHITFTAN